MFIGRNLGSEGGNKRRERKENRQKRKRGKWGKSRVGDERLLQVARI